MRRGADRVPAHAIVGEMAMLGAPFDTLLRRMCHPGLGGSDLFRAVVMLRRLLDEDKVELDGMPKQEAKYALMFLLRNLFDTSYEHPWTDGSKATNEEDEEDAVPPGFLDAEKYASGSDDD